MSEMIERVAKAICLSRSCEGWACCQNPAQMGRSNCPVKNGGYDDAARAAIAATRDPTEAMLVKRDHWLSEADATRMWQAMIDEMLK